MAFAGPDRRRRAVVLFQVLSSLCPFISSPAVMRQQSQTTWNKKFILKNYKEPNLSKRIQMLHRLYRDPMARASL